MKKKILTKNDLFKRTIPRTFGGEGYNKFEKEMLNHKEYRISINGKETAPFPFITSERFDHTITSEMFNHISRSARNTELKFSKIIDANELEIVMSKSFTIKSTSIMIDYINLIDCDTNEETPLRNLMHESSIGVINTEVIPKGSIVRFTYVDRRFDSAEQYIEFIDQIGFVRVSSIHCLEIEFKIWNDVNKITISPSDLFNECDDLTDVELNIEILDIESMMR